MTDIIKKIIKSFDKEFGHHGEIWNGKKGSEEGVEVKQWLTRSLGQTIKEAKNEERKKIFKRIRETLGDSAYFEINSEVKSAENRILNYIINLEADFLKQQDTLSLEEKEKKIYGR